MNFFNLAVNSPNALGTWHRICQLPIGMSFIWRHTDAWWGFERLDQDTYRLTSGCADSHRHLDRVDGGAVVDGGMSWRIGPRSGEGAYVMDGKDCVAHAYLGANKSEEYINLIAAAPELLETCKECMGFLSLPCDDECKDDCSHWKLRDKVQAAIAKAEGRQS